MPSNPRNPEQVRLAEDEERKKNWKRWGPYLSDREWGTVREDYSSDGESWRYLTHEHARSRAYRWGEDGILGLTDRECRLCFAVSMWNGRDSVIKERLFGLTNTEGNHGEDIKECHFYLDSTPTHSWMSALYKYPQAAFPYERLRAESRGRTRDDPEFELSDTGIFAEGRYFDVTAEYAKADADDICIRITVANRGPDRASIHLLPTLWFRNTWSWGCKHEGCSLKPRMAAVSDTRVECTHETLGKMILDVEGFEAGAAPLLFTENETNAALLFGDTNSSAYVKDSIGDFVVAGRREAVNPARRGTKCAAHFTLDLGAGEKQSVRLRLRVGDAASAGAFGDEFEGVLSSRRSEADQFYDGLPGPRDPEARRVARQANAGLLWSKQFYNYIVEDWLKGRPELSPAAGLAQEWQEQRLAPRVFARHHQHAGQVGVPVVCGLGLGFPHDSHGATRSRFAKQQLNLLLREWYMHPNGQIPAYEWNFSDVNPPCARMGMLAGLQDNGSAREAGPGLSRQRLPEAPRQLHLVGQPQGRVRSPHI